MMKHAAALPQAGHRPVPGLLAAVAQGFETLLLWQDRARQRHRLRQFDDRMLSDIGLSRADVHQETDKPFWLP